MMVASCTSSASSLQFLIGITQHSFATDGDIWLVTLACGYESTLS
uniref:Uncharacterized protein n=1 Tax=Brassica campestris TaxID=3711 RepID=A0A3P5YPA3_BRACM|nr:unnamed protein product [Brassica rapa]